MLNKVCEPQLVVILEDTPRVNHQPQLRAFLRVSVRFDEITHPVGERTSTHLRIPGELTLSVGEDLVS